MLQNQTNTNNYFCNLILWTQKQTIVNVISFETISILSTVQLKKKKTFYICVRERKSLSILEIIDLKHDKFSSNWIKKKKKNFQQLNS